jgi:hypothetical protein
VSLFARVRRESAEQRKARTKRFDPVAAAFGQQREAITCHALFLALCCSGRSGKTRGACLKWLEVCERKPGELSAFIGLTLKSAKRTAWRQLKKLDQEHGLGLAFNVAELTITHPNGSQLILLGANRDDLIDVMRGSPFAFVFLDETAFFREGLVQNLIDDALLIRMMDLEGELWIASTPGYVLAGYHYDVVSGLKPGWRVFQWTYFDNPHLPEYPVESDPEKRYALRLKAAVAVREKMGWTEDTPSYVREWKGLYVDDPEALVYAFNRQLHMVDEVPADFYTNRSAWHVVIGEDFGSTNATAWVVWAFRKHSPDVYCLRAFKRYGLPPSECADITRDLKAEFNPDAIVGDSAAKGYIDEHRARHQIEIQGADKQGKRAHQISMNDAFRAVPAPRIRLVRGQCDEYAGELEKLGKDPRFDKRHPRYGEEDPRAENDLCDAGLYGWWHCWAWVEEYERQEAEEKARNTLPQYPAAGTAFQNLYVNPPPVPNAGLRGAFGIGSLRRRG